MSLIGGVLYILTRDQVTIDVRDAVIHLRRRISMLNAKENVLDRLACSTITRHLNVANAML